MRRQVGRRSSSLKRSLVFRICRPMDEAGSVSIIGAAAVILVSAVATLVVDAGFAYLSKRELQGAVDIAALNAVQAPTRIEATARDAIQKNYGDPDGLTAFEVTPGEFPT